MREKKTPQGLVAGGIHVLGVHVMITGHDEGDGGEDLLLAGAGFEEFCLFVVND